MKNLIVLITVVILVATGAMNQKETKSKASYETPQLLELQLSNLIEKSSETKTLNVRGIK